MKRNRLTVLMVLLTIIALAATSFPGRLLAQGDKIELTDPATGAQPYKGMQLRLVNTEVVPVLTYERQILDPEYEKASGVTLVYDNISHDALLAKMQTMCAAKADDYDIMFVEDGWAGSLHALGCLEPLDRFYKAAPGDSHPEDFTLRAFGTVAMHRENWYGLPILVAVGIFSYRSDLFTDPKEQEAFKAKYGRDLKVPETWEELLEVGEFFTRPDQGLYGFNYRYGTPNNALFDMVIHFGFSRGFNFYDENYKPLFNTPEAIDAVSFFTAKKFLDLQPPGRESFQFGEVIQNFTQGKVAMYGTESWAIPLLLDPKGSTVADKTAFALLPGWKDPASGEIKRALLSAGPAYMINANIPEERKRMAWDYLQYAHGKTLALKLALESGAGHRVSALTNPDVVAKYPFAALLVEQMKVGIGRPNDAWWPKAEFILGSKIQEAAGGKDAKTALDEAQAETEALVKENVQAGQKYVTSAEREKFVCAKFADLGIAHPEC